jgi:plastocyanin
MRKVLVILGAVFTAVLAAPLSAAAASTSAQIVSCSSNQFGCFSPNPIRITTGSTVTWTNNTGPTHTATSDTGAWDTGNITTGQTSSPIAFNSAGTFTYHCSIHLSMHGTVIVSAAAAATPTPAGTVQPAATPRMQSLARTGDGPGLPLGAGLTLLGLLLLAAGGLRRKYREEV